MSAPSGIIMAASTGCLKALRDDPEARGVFVSAVREGVAVIEARNTAASALAQRPSSTTSMRSLRQLADKSSLDGAVRNPYFGAK